KLADSLDPQSALIQWSNDSKQLAYLGSDGKYDDLVVQTIATGEARLLLHQLAIQSFQWSPKGPQIAVVFSEPPRDRKHVDLEAEDENQEQTGPDLYVITALDNSKTRLTTGSAVEEFEWSPSGDAISFSSGSDLFAVPVSGGSAKRLIARP